jgi:hypothetical protein
MSNILLISETYLKENSPINANVDPKDILPHIDRSQDLWTQELLGTNFYNYILNSYSAQTLNNYEVELVSRIKIALVYRTCEMALPFINYNIKNKGIQSQFGDYSNQVGVEEMRILRWELRNKAEFYDERVKSYLKENSKQFPQYITNNNTDIKPDNYTSSFDCDLAFKD